MAVKFFGQFLVEKGVVTREVLLQAIELQESVNLSFGATAMAMGLLTEADIEKVHNAQRCEDLRFGDMAVKLELLTADQMQQVLTRQRTATFTSAKPWSRSAGFPPTTFPATWTNSRRIRPSMPLTR